jgi:hypothetical protein
MDSDSDEDTLDAFMATLVDATPQVAASSPGALSAAALVRLGTSLETGLSAAALARSLSGSEGGGGSSTVPSQLSSEQLQDLAARDPVAFLSA